MDSIITIIFIWLLITILNYLSKRIKKAQKSAPSTTAPPPVTEKSEIPPFLREIFNLPEQKKTTTPAPSMDKEAESKESEFSIERETREEYKKRKETKKPALISESIIPPKITPIPDVQEVPVHKYLGRLTSLKEAVIWKEILDRPVSMKPFLYRRRD